MEPWNSEVVDKTTVFESFAETMKAIANGRRLELLELLAQGEHSVDDLARLSGMAVTTTSAHLQTLRRAGLVRRRRAETRIFYSAAGYDVAELYAVAKRVALEPVSF